MSIPTQPYTAEDLAAVKEVNRKRFLESCERRETGAQRKAREREEERSIGPHYRHLYLMGVGGTADQLTLYRVGIRDDGSLINPHGYPESVVRRAVTEARQRIVEKDTTSAKKAAATRKRRTDLRTHQIAKAIIAQEKIGPRNNCARCGRGLTDEESIARGIGSECWEDILQMAEAMAAGDQK